MVWVIMLCVFNFCSQRSNECGTDPYYGTANEFGYRAEDEMLHINQIMNENNDGLLPDVDRITSKKVSS